MTDNTQTFDFLNEDAYGSTQIENNPKVTVKESEYSKNFKLREQFSDAEFEFVKVDGEIPTTITFQKVMNTTAEGKTFPTVHYELSFEVNGKKYFSPRIVGFNGSINNNALVWDKTEREGLLNYNFVFDTNKTSADLIDDATRIKKVVGKDKYGRDAYEEKNLENVISSQFLDSLGTDPIKFYGKVKINNAELVVPRFATKGEKVENPVEFLKSKGLENETVDTIAEGPIISSDGTMKLKTVIIRNEAKEIVAKELHVIKAAPQQTIQVRRNRFPSTKTPGKWIYYNEMLGRVNGEIKNFMAKHPRSNDDFKKTKYDPSANKPSAEEVKSASFSKGR